MKRTLKFLSYSVALLFCLLTLLCAFQFVRLKVSIARLPFEQIVAMCTGQTTPEATCECYNYYGRHCMSQKRLVWDWVPTDGDAEAPESSKSRGSQVGKDLIEEELYLPTEEGV